MKIISVSRRTDIPAYYGEWFMQRLADGYAGHINPFNNKKHIVSLKKEDIISIALWSKNFKPFTASALLLKDEGYSLFFNYTLTGLPEIFEPGKPDESEILESIKFLSSRFSPWHINWRYDPILLSDITPAAYHIDKFRFICKTLSGYVKRCYISFPAIYGKVERSFMNFTDTTGVTIYSPAVSERKSLAEILAEIAGNYGIRIFSCCGDYLAENKIEKAHCIDAGILSSLSGKNLSSLKTGSTRKECGCTTSTDIGTYDTCPHGCVYCYANSSFKKASHFYKNFKKDEKYSGSAFLGITKELSDKFIQDNNQSRNEENIIQHELFRDN